MNKSILYFAFMVTILLSRQLRIDIDDCQPAATKPPFYSGTTNNWVDYPESPKYTGIYVDVNISALGFKVAPIVFTALSGTSSHWAITGTSSVYNITKDGFRVYIKFANEAPLTVAMAKSNSYVLNYILIPVG